mgnify:CR=1 FL=1
MTARFDPGCRRCPRLAAHRDEVAERYPDYHAAPVAPFGVERPRLLIVGLAPGLHGANATGRPFTGDYAGILLYQTLHRFGFANQAEAVSRDDGLELTGCRVTNAVKCLPPANKPAGSEVRTCNGFLARELGELPANAVVLALGRVAHDAVLRACGLRQRDHPFGHGACHALERRWLVDSYHCSRYNTQTRRLTEPMFEAVFQQVSDLLDRTRG